MNKDSSAAKNNKKTQVQKNVKTPVKTPVKSTKVSAKKPASDMSKSQKIEKKIKTQTTKSEKAKKTKKTSVESEKDDLEELDQIYKKDQMHPDKLDESSDEGTEITDIDQMIRFVIREVHHLRYKDRVDILCIIKDQVGTDVIYESSDGSRVQMKKLGNDIIKQIYNLVVGRLKEVDIITDS
jgi:flagellar motor protein MotB